MSCDDVTIIEAWAQDDRFDWVKRPVPAGTRAPYQHHPYRTGSGRMGSLVPL